MTSKRMLLASLALAFASPAAPAQDVSRDSVAILRTILLPRVSEILRERGIPPEEIETTIFGARERGVPPSEMAGIFEETARAVDEHGPIENFGAFVQRQLAAGLRGPELAAAIRAEHASRGIGKGRRIESRRRGRTTQPQSGEVRDTTGRRGPPVTPGQRRPRPDSIPSTKEPRRQGGNGGAR